MPLTVLCKVQKCKLVTSSTTERQKGFHLFFLELESVGWLLLFILKLISMSSSALLAVPSVQRLDKKTWAFMPEKWRPSSLWVNRLDWAREPVLLHFFTGVGTRDLGVSSDVRERLFRVSDNCSLLMVWRHLSPPVPMPTISSEGSMESCGGQPGLMLSALLLLWLLSFLWVDWRLVVVVLVLCLFSTDWPWYDVAAPWRCKGCLGVVQWWGTGRSKLRGEETPKLTLSSSVVCRLPSELPVARDDSLWEGCCTQKK